MIYEFIIGIWDTKSTPMLMMNNLFLNQNIKIKEVSGFVSFLIDKLPLGKGSYTLSLRIKKNGIDMDFIGDAYLFEVENGNYFNQNISYPEWFQGFYTDFKVLQ